jgi:gamma-glutamyltranspeptidase/glutathione hydrolase
MTFVHRPVLMTEEGAVVSGHHKASEVGAAVLRDGGNAIDAAIAASAALCVAVPHMNGIGGDCIALYFDAETRSTTVINGSGRAPLAASADAIRQRGHSEMPGRGPLSISVCGLVDAWARSIERFGTRHLSDLLKPAVRLAENGIPLDLNLETFLSGPVYEELARNNPHLASLYGAPGSHHIGSRLRNPALARSLEAIRVEGHQAFYRSSVGRALIADLAEAGALISERDLADHETRFDQPLIVEYLGRHLHAAPPNTQGLALAVLSGLADLAAQRHGRPMPTTPADFLRRKTIAFTCRAQFAGDPERTDRPDHLLTREGLIDLDSTPGGAPGPTERAAGDTSTLVVVDRWGNAVSWVQSLFQEFGSGVASLSTGIVMHNRLGLQSLDPDSSTPLRAGERPFHTLCPALVVKDGTCEVAIATPGDHGQPQSIHQVLTRLYADGDDIQAAIEAPRIRHDSGLEVMIEDRVPEEWLTEIEAAGFGITKIGPWSRLAGGVNAIQRHPDGLMFAGADPRRSSYAVTAD